MGMILTIDAVSDLLPISRDSRKLYLCLLYTSGLGRVLMSAVACVDHRDIGLGGIYHGSAFFGVAHGADIRITGNDADRIGNTRCV